MSKFIHNTEFIKSSPDLKSCPEDNLPEYAFVGRSNVGKSSLINFLVSRKKLAKTSSDPGRTRLINHFKVDKSWYLVDLPGYGYAKVSKSEREKFMKLIRSYLLGRKSLVCLFLLIDSRHSPQKNDLEFIQWLGINEVPFVLCYTKTDKLSAGNLKASIKNYKETLQKSWDHLPLVFLTSTVQNAGRDEILSFIKKTNSELNA